MVVVSVDYYLILINPIRYYIVRRGFQAQSMAKSMKVRAESR
jgi:hypothetical protein